MNHCEEEVNHCEDVAAGLHLAQPEEADEPRRVADEAADARADGEARREDAARQRQRDAWGGVEPLLGGDEDAARQWQRDAYSGSSAARRATWARPGSKAPQAV